MKHILLTALLCGAILLSFLDGAMAPAAQAFRRYGERLEALSPIPYHTELADRMSPAMEQALEEVKLVDEMITAERTFEDYVQALEPRPAMYQFDYIPQEDQWLPADPNQTYPYGEAWNVFPAAELEERFRLRFGMDLAANGRAWLNDGDFRGGPCRRATPEARP